MRPQRFILIPVRRALALALVCGAFAACDSTPVGPSVEPHAAPIVGGQEVTTCQWPSTVSALCTASLVHPRVITLAAHCPTPTEMTFGETQSAPTRTVAIERCEAHPQFPMADIQFCVLREAVTDVPIVPILMGCEKDILKRGQTITLVGFGATGPGGAGRGIKRAVETPVVNVGPTEIVVGTDTKTACHGDSGGPAFVRLGDGTWRVFGVTSHAAGGDCAGPTVYTLIHAYVPWIEKESGIDITPCHDADGAWNPGPSCGRFPTDPGAAGRSWANGCQGATAATPSATCGMAAGEATGGSGGAGGASSGGSAGAAGGSAGGAGSEGSAGAGGGGRSGQGEGGASGEAGGSGGAAGSAAAGASGEGPHGGSSGTGGSSGGAGEPGVSGGAGGDRPAGGGGAGGRGNEAGAGAAGKPAAAAGGQGGAQLGPQGGSSDKPGDDAGHSGGCAVGGGDPSTIWPSVVLAWALRRRRRRSGAR